MAFSRVYIIHVDSRRNMLFTLMLWLTWTIFSLLLVYAVVDCDRVMYEINYLLLFPQWVGSPCGLHGPYIFYKAFRFHLEGKPRILSLGDFFFVRCKPGDPICIAELQLLWEERTSKQLLSSSKLYFLPEDTPQGRTVSHGEVINFVFVHIVCPAVYCFRLTAAFIHN